MYCAKCKCVIHRLTRSRATPLCTACVKRTILVRCSLDNYYVYKLTDRKHRLLYIGLTTSPMARLHAHCKTKKFYYMEIVHSFPDATKAFECERNLIFLHAPSLNKVGGITPRKTRKVKKLNEVKIAQGEKTAEISAYKSYLSDLIVQTVSNCKSKQLPLWYAFTDDINS